MPPNYDLLSVFGYSYFILLWPHGHTKLEPRDHLCCFLRYGIENKSYKCYDPITNKLWISHHIIFWEHKMFTILSTLHSISPHRLFTNSLVLFSKSISSNIGSSSSISDILSITLTKPNYLVDPPHMSQEIFYSRSSHAIKRLLLLVNLHRSTQDISLLFILVIFIVTLPLPPYMNLLSIKRPIYNTCW